MRRKSGNGRTWLVATPTRRNARLTGLRTAPGAIEAIEAFCDCLRRGVTSVFTPGEVTPRRGRNPTLPARDTTSVRGFSSRAYPRLIGTLVPARQIGLGC